MIELDGVSPANYLVGAAVQLFFTSLRIVVALTVLTKISGAIPMLARVSIGLSIGCLGLMAANPAQLRELALLSESSVLAVALFDACWVVVLIAPTALALEILPTAGRLIDTFRGNQLAEQLLPDLSDRVSPLEYAGGLFAAWLFVEAGGLHRLLGSLVYNTKSLVTVLPSLNVLPAANTPISSATTERVAVSQEILLQAAGSALYDGLRIAMPVMVVCLVIDAAALVLSRIVPRIAIATELSAVKLVVGLVLTSLFATHQQLSRSSLPVSSSGGVMTGCGQGWSSDAGSVGCSETRIEVPAGQRVASNSE